MSCATADDGDAPLASGVEVALIAEELARGLADAPLPGPTLAAELRRRAGAPAATAAETVGLTPTLSELTVAVDGALGSELVAVDADRSASALVLVPAGGGHALAEVAVRPLDLRADLTRPAAGAAAGTVVRKLDGQVRAARPPTTSTPGPPSGWLSPAPTWWEPCGGPSTSPSSTPAAAGSSAGPSARSRLSSTCWPTPSC